VQRLTEGDFITSLPHDVVIVDAIFGTGINRKLEGYPGAFISQLNTLQNEKIAIDLPSGLPADTRPQEEGPILQAQHTLTFQQYKRAMLHPETGIYCGTVHVLDIGLLPAFPANVSTSWHTLDKQFVKARYRPRKPFSHKGTYGTAMLIGGSHGMMGAILLATAAAGRAGAGKVRALIPECGHGILQTAIPEAMCRTSGTRFLEEPDEWESADGIGIGPGLGTEPDTATAFESFLYDVEKPVVLDADALNLLEGRPELLGMIPRNSILTPHPKEFGRVFGATDDSYALAELARQKAMEHQIIIVSKNRYTLIALPDGRCYYNIAGNAGLATGGSGDVLCGIITGLLAQSYEPENAALLGVYLHATAGDAAAQQMGMEALVAGDILDYIGTAYRSLLA
jgi:NAD(P)H-hydrate epimerase